MDGLSSAFLGKGERDMEFPIWAIFAFMAASFSAAFMLIQERLNVNGFALAFWNKVACATFALPIALYLGFPSSPIFYALVAGQALLWVISDVIFFSTIPKVGAGVVSRILPVSVILTFFLWFAFDPALFMTYLQEPIKSAGIVIVLCASVYFALKLRHCQFSWQAFRLLWFVIFAAVVGPIAFKLITQHTTIEKGPFAFVFCEALVMISLWWIFYLIRRPVPKETLLSKTAIKGGFIVGAFSCSMVASNFAAIYYVDNPGLVPAVKFLDTFLILVWYALRGKKEDADVVSGLGIVACAAVIVLLKSM